MMPAIPSASYPTEALALASPATHFSREAAKGAKESIANVIPSRLRGFA
jgi:hypothetical protein